MAQTSAKLIELIGTGTLPQTRLTLESALASYAVGKVDFLTLLTNLLNVLSQELQYAQELTNLEKARANLERVVSTALEVAHQAPLRPLAEDGGPRRLQVPVLHGTWSRGTAGLEDPISGEKRDFSGFFPDWEWNADYRHDIGNFSYGFTLGDRDRFTFFRTDEFDINFNEGPVATAFVEYRPTARTSITIDVDNAINTRGMRRRIIFDPNRADPDRIIDEFEAWTKKRGIALTKIDLETFRRACELGMFR